MITRQLVTAKQINLAKTLLYRVYVEKMRWNIKPGNPSNIRPVESEFGTMLEDSFVDRSQWFGIEHDGILMGVCRIMHSPNVELEQFTSLPAGIKQSNFVELNRVAIEPGEGAERYMLKMIYDVVRYCDDNNFDKIVMGVNFPNPGENYVKLGLQKVEEGSFRYDEAEMNQSHVAFFDLKDNTTKQRFFSICEQLLQL